MTDQAVTKQVTVFDMIADPKFAKQVKMALPRVGVTADTMIRAVMTSMRMTPKLAQCSPASLMASLMQSAQLGLTPNTPQGLAYLIPYGNEATFVVGYQGVVQLAHRSGDIASISTEIVYEADEFEYEKGLDEKLRHKEFQGPEEKRGKPIGAWAVVKTQSGGRYFEFWGAERLLAHRKRYVKAAKGKSAWDDERWEWMWKKTVVKQALRLAPASTELSHAIAADDRGEVGLAPEVDITGFGSDAPAEAAPAEEKSATDAIREAAAAKAAESAKKGEPGSSGTGGD